MALLDGKRLIISGVLTDDSIAYAVAETAIYHGAKVLLTNAPGRPSSIMGRIAKRLPDDPVALVEADLTDEDGVQALREAAERYWGGVDGILHAVAFAPPTALGGNFLNTQWEDVATAIEVSAYSLKAMVVGLRPLLEKAGDKGASVVSLDFDATVAWPVYDWMGVAKASLESITRYLARDLGPSKIRVNTVSSGPIQTMAGKSIPGFNQLADAWESQAPLGWNVRDAGSVADTVAYLFSDLSRGMTGSVLHVDGGYHAMGAPVVGASTRSVESGR
ncbi:enoyl-ACP reductase [Streptomyces eurocidicus]|uniref:Enoyl-[acyl-carrier-protein] reductase [NADH] n=1 Tax=Streptomyces eurocidicus TaxID=66423 RepID=A0A2N8NNH0_STREU|nr:enoyl-ACP reductase FabI [Streptomyces eurocidicus]MBB5123086.1 enoyl-[acyl-carrier protein] reductase I [Streptomyces eurocidicus]MBF6056159.1 enoyl-ACP reductase FabI [Streptomyces eurocidicus]PNE30319.1 enoyl-ACP reductase [Streptomyces eurocidicus]